MNEMTVVTPSVELVNGLPVVNSLNVARHFGKNHYDLLRDIKKLECSQAFIESNFAFNEWRDARNRKLPSYNITRDGLMFLVMGFTGPQAARMKEAYIQRFNELEAATRMPAKQLDYFKRCERDLVQSQRRCIRLQASLLRMQRLQIRQLGGRVLRPAAESIQGELPLGAAA